MQDHLSQPREGVDLTTLARRASEGLETSSEIGKSPNAKRWPHHATLLAYLIFCPALSLIVHRLVDLSKNSIWSLQDSRTLLVWLMGLVGLALFQWLLYIPIGFLTSRLSSIRLGFGMAMLLSIGLTVAVRALEIAPEGRLPQPADFVLPLFGCLVGTWLGSRKPPALALKFLLLVSALVLTGPTLALLLIERTPLPFEPAPVTSEGKRELVKLFQEKDPRDIGPGETESLTLTTDQINRLLAWGLTIGSADRKALVQFDQSVAELECSIGLPVPKLGVWYLNVAARGQVEVAAGHVSVHDASVRVGRVSVPSWIVDGISMAMIGAVERDRNAHPLLHAIERVSIEPGRITAVLGPMELPSGFASDVFTRMKPGSDVLPITRIYVQHLLDRSQDAPAGQGAFGWYMEEAFKLAQDRSRDGDPIAENRAAVFALAILLGHWRVQTFVGRALPADTPHEVLRPFGSVTVRGRADWTKHFWVSAALALISNEASSDAAGLLKEELDAGKGGSGFSFGDLLADRCGTTFSLTATRNRASARTLQKRLARGFVLDDFFPPAADLPEDLPDAKLQEHFGGVGGEQYNQLVDEIERRISGCSAYR